MCVKSCENCEFGIKEGGDWVPYGMGSVQTPEYIECDCPDIDEDIEDPCEKTENGKNCEYFKMK